jgi:phosphate-selective porin OprO/OprP
MKPFKATKPRSSRWPLFSLRALLAATATGSVMFCGTAFAQGPYDYDDAVVLPPPVSGYFAESENERSADDEPELLLAQKDDDKKADAKKPADDKKDAKKDDASKEKKADEGYVVGTDLSFTPVWKDGLELQTKNKDFRIHIGGRTQFDAGWFNADQSIYNPNGTPTAGLGNVYGDGVDFRRARFRIDGTMYETCEFAAEYDFMNSARVQGQRPNALRPLEATSTTSPPGAPPSTLTFFDQTTTAPTDLWWQFNGVPLFGNIRIGNQKEAIGFEHLVSSRYLPFMERSYNQDTFYGGAFNGFVPGISFSDTVGEEAMGSWNIGVYKPMNSVFAFNTGDGDYSITGRLTRLLWYECEGRSLLHLGLSGRQATAYGQAGNFYLNPAGNGGLGSVGPGRVQTFRTRDAIRTGLSAEWPTPANISLFGSDMQWINAEIAAVQGRWTLQGEYLLSYLHDARTQWDGPQGNTAFYHGGYLQLLCFLTDDYDRYDKKRAAFDRMRPTENAFWAKDCEGCGLWGLGAWQAGARYNYLNLDNNGLNGGTLHNLTGGLNWFLNPNMKMQFNYIATYRNAPIAQGVGDGWIHGWGCRLAHDF